MKVSLLALLHDHDRIDIAATALASLCDAPAIDVAAAIHGRVALAAAIADHIAREDGVLYPEIEPRPSGPSAESRLYADEFDALRDDWADYLATWPAQAAHDDPPGFAAATCRIVALMTDRLRRENECLYPLALRQGTVTLR